jgi:hypothetical protein
MINTINPIDITVLSKDDLADVFTNAAIGGFNTTYPNEEIPDRSVTTGTVYKNKKQYSCQIKFTGNNVICMCTYDVERRRFTNRFYRLESELDCIYGVVNEQEKGFAHIQPKFHKGEN